MAANPNNQFSIVQATRAINRVPNQYGQARQRNLFKPKPSLSTTIRLMEANGVISLVPVQDRGGAPAANQKAGRNYRYLDIPHFPLSDRVHAESVQNSADWETGESLDTIALAKARSMVEMRNKLAITEEFLMLGALSGILTDWDGQQVIYDLYSQFGVTQKTISFALGTSTTNVRKKCLDVSRHIDDNLLGDVITGVEAWCSSDFFDNLISHPNVEKVFVNHMEAVERLGGDPRAGFRFGGVLFSEYRAKAPGKNGVMLNFIENSSAIAFPIGTLDTFDLWYGPPVLDGINRANVLPPQPDPGQTSVAPIYALETPDPKGRFVEIDTELDVLPLCKRPGVLVKLTVS